jgi:uncharacterized repeat protein (TIGR01451 family)
MVGKRQYVCALAVVALAGGLLGCKSYGTPGGAVVPIGGGEGTGTASASSAPKAESKPAASTSTAKAESKPASSSSSAANAPKAESKPVVAAQPAMGASVAYYPTGVRNGSALMVEKMAPGELAAGQSAEYLIKVTNIAGCTIENVVINEALPQGFTMTGSNPQGSQAGSGMAFNLGSLAAGESKTIAIKGSFSKAGSYSSCATANYTIPVCMAVNVVSPALKLAKTAPAEVILCDNWPVKLVVSNDGTGTARNVVVRDPLPAGVTFEGKNAIEWNVGDLRGGGSQERTFMVKADKVGSYPNTASATAEGLTANSNSTTTVVKAPALAIDKVCPDKLYIGRPVRYTIKVTNTGNAPANNTVVRDAVPAGLSFGNATEGGSLQGGAVVWNLGTLAPGQSRDLTVTFNGGGVGTVMNEAIASADCAAQVKDGCSTSLQGLPDIGTGIEDFDGVRALGEPHEYEYTVKNQGQVDLTNVTMTAELEPGLEYVSTTWAGGAQAAGQTVSWKIGTLKVGESKKFKFTAKGSKTGDLIVRSVTKSDQTREVRNDEQVNYVER